ncbi:MAG: energy-coupling factor transporter transmembrane protein EcfT [Treponema sp.]|jgi:energy-coupling factor transporter transmembrane protein EcfT|nr:energy-coupling factor transporter transmembrane protein EcfT [Treponema sp.]
MYLDRPGFKKDPLKSFDGRCRLLAAASVIISAVTITDAALLCAVTLIFLCALPGEFPATIRRLVPANMMAAALWLPVAAGFDPRSALLYTLRINCAALGYMRFVAPMSISLIASSLSALKLPEKLVALFVLTHRSIFLLYDGLATALAAMRSRLPRNGSVYQWRSLAAVFAAALTRAALRSEKVRIAMSNRGFDGGFPVTVSFSWGIRDTALLTACAGFFAGVVWLA